MVFVPRQKAYAQFCSRECGFKGQDRSISREAFAKHRADLAANARPKLSRPIAFVRCAYSHCATIFMAKVNGHRYCSKECLRRDRMVIPTSEMRLCLECGSPFLVGASVGIRASRVFCSDKCLERVSRRESRMRRSAKCAETIGMSQRVTFKALWDRSSRCHICGEWCSRKYSGLHPLTPTIDHIDPISKGGMHLISNAAIAHRMCNTIKSNRPLTKQVSDRCKREVLRFKASMAESDGITSAEPPPPRAGQLPQLQMS